MKSNIDIVILKDEYPGDRLRYFLRSVCKFIKFVNNIYIIVKNHEEIPNWLNARDNIILLTYDDLYHSCGEEISKNIIEQYIPTIPGLTERFIYFSDSVVISEPGEITQFFDNNKCCIFSTVKFINPKNYNQDEITMYHNSKHIDQLCNLKKHKYEYEYINRGIIPLYKTPHNLLGNTNDPKFDIRLYALYLQKHGYSNFNTISIKKLTDNE